MLLNNGDKQKNWIQKDTQIPSFDLVSFSMSDRKEKIPVATVAIELKLSRFASISGNGIFLTPNLMNRFTYIPEKLVSRKMNVVRKTAYIDLDSIVYHLPEDFYPEFLPESFKFNSHFGEYESSFSVSQGKVLYTRKLKMVKGEFPPETYNELIDFYKAINKADHVKIVFVNKT